MSLPTIQQSRNCSNLYSIIVRVQMVPAKDVTCLGRTTRVPAELLTWRLPVTQDPFNHNGLHTYKTNNPEEMNRLMRAYKNQEWI